MRKRKGTKEIVEEESSDGQDAVVSVSPLKRAKREDPLDKLISLLSSEGSLIAGLTYLLTSVKHESDNESAMPEPLLPRYLEKYPECEHLLAPFSWHKEKRTFDVLLLCFEVLEQVLLFTAPHQTTVSSLSTSTVPYHTIGKKLTQTVIENHMRVFYSSLMTSVPMKLVAACLRALVAMVMQGLESARELQQVFNFGYKPLEVFPNRTNTIQGRSDSVRTCFMNFALSFLVVGDSDVIRTTMETKGFLSSLFKLLLKDPAETILLFLSTLDKKVVQDPTIPKKTKSRFFNSYVLKHMSQLLTTPTDHTLSLLEHLQEYVYEFLLRLCTDFQLGVCYKHKELPAGLQKTTNPVILNLLLSLTGSLTRPLVRTLVLNTLTTCPDLILSYLNDLTMNFDPQPSSKWVTNIQFITKLYSLLPPVRALLCAESTSDLPLSYMDVGVGLTVPMATTRSSLSHGLQHPLLLVKFQSLELLRVILRRAVELVGASVPTRSLDTTGSFLVKYCDSVLRLLPDVQTLIAMHGQLSSVGVASGCGPSTDKLDASHQLRNAELQESPDLISTLLTVVRGYQTLSPTIFIQAGYNLTKLLPAETREGDIESSMLIPTLQLLIEAPTVSVKSTQKGGSALRSVLKLTISPEEEIAKMASCLVQKLLVSMDMFKEHDTEVTLLLMTLRECHSYQVVEFVGGAILEAIKGEKMTPEAAKMETKELEAEDEEREVPTLEKILASTFIIPHALLPCGSCVTRQQQDQPKKVSPLLQIFLSDRSNSGDAVEKFQDSLLRKLVLTNPSVAPVVSQARPTFFSETDTANEASCVAMLASCLCEGVWGVELMISEECREWMLGRWTELSVGVDDFDCFVRAVCATLWQMFTDSVNNLSLSHFLFNLLEEAISKMAQQSTATSPLLTEILESCLIREAFLTPRLFQVARARRKKEQERLSMALHFNRRIGQLLSIVNFFPSLKSLSSVQEARDKLLTKVESHLTHPSSSSAIDDLLSELLQGLGASIDPDRISKLFDTLLSHNSINKDSIPFLASILTIFNEPEGTIHPKEDQGLNRPLCCELNSRVHLSDNSLERLVKLAVQTDSTMLHKPVYLILKQQVSNTTDKTGETNQSSFAAESDSISSNIDAILKSLLSVRIDKPDTQSPLSEPRPSVSKLLVTPSDTYIDDKLDKIYSCLNISCAQNYRTKRILDSSQITRPSSIPHTNAHRVSNKVLKKLLKHCTHHVSVVSGDIATLLFQASKDLLDYFKSHSLLSEVCSRITQERMETDEGCYEDEQLCLLRLLGAFLKHSMDDGWEDELVCVKDLWRVCVDLLASSDCTDTQDTCSTILCAIAARTPKGQKRIEKLLRKWKKSGKELTIPQLSLALSLPVHLSCLPFSTLEQSLQSLCDLIKAGTDGSQEEERLTKDTVRFIKDCLVLDADVGPDVEGVSQFIYTALKHHFTSPTTLSLLSLLVKLLHKWAADDNECGFDLATMYERVWSHSKFLPVMCLSHDQEDSHLNIHVKEALIQMLVTIVELDSSLGNTAHVPLLLGAYSATRSKSDQGILYLLYKYEEGGTSLDKHRPFLWGPAALEHYKQRQETSWLLWKQPGTQEVIGQLKRELLLESTHKFPLDTELNPVNPFSEDECTKTTELYDPCFLLPLLTQQLDPGNLVDCRRFIDSGCLGYLISALSSTVEGVRSVSGCGLERFVSHLEGSRFREKTQISLLLEVLKNTLCEKNMRLPSIFAAFFSTTASLLLHPESPLYSVVAHYLVYKPALDLGEIPLLMTTLHSSSIEHKTERVWILQLLVNGLRCKDDYSLYRKKRVFDHCLSLIRTGIVGKRCQILILELVLRGVAIPEVAVDLVLNKGLITSLEFVKTDRRT